MPELYEPANPLNMPFHCFTYRSASQPFPIKPHWHYFAELILVREGNVLMNGSHDPRELKPGEAFFVYPNAMHSIQSADGGDVVYDVIKMDVNQFSNAPAYAPPLRDLIEDISRRNMPSWFSAQEAEAMNMAGIIRECVEEDAAHRYGYDLLIQSTLYTLFTKMIRGWMDKGFDVQQSVFRSELFGSVFSITSYIEAHLRESLKVEELARYCRMSYPSFARKFKELYGISCKEYIEEVRVARAEHFLLFTSCDLTYICQETGYSDCSHMIRDFKRLRNTTPGKYRMDHKNV